MTTLPTRLAHRCAALLLAGAAPALLLAQSLQWEQETKSFDADFEQEAVTATYQFTNTGVFPVTIVDTDASCGCTVPSLAKTEFAPGESGELEAVFTIGSRQGKQRKLITVVTETPDGERFTHELRLEVDIPIPVTFEPRVRFWKVEEANTTQDILVTFHERMPMSLDGLEHKEGYDAERFDYEIETLEPERQYRIKITPKQSGQQARDIAFLVSEDDDRGILKKHPIYAYVR